MTFRKSILRTPFVLTFFVVLGGCLTDRPEVYDLDPTMAGAQGHGYRRIVDGTGRPVSGALIQLFRMPGCDGGGASISMWSRFDGYYPKSSWDTGLFQVMVRDSTMKNGVWIDSIRLRDSLFPTGLDTLRPLCSIHGVVAFESGMAPTEAGVGLSNTSIWSRAALDGSFVLDGIPAGTYDLYAWVRPSSHDSAHRKVTLAPGQNLVFTDSLVAPYVGLRTESVRVVQDTLSGDVRLAWSVPLSPDVFGFKIDRTVRGVNESWDNQVFLEKDSAWTDSLHSYWERQPTYGPWSPVTLEYRLSARASKYELDTHVVVGKLVASPPSWTRHMDSLDVSMEIDSVHSIATLRWNSPEHPQLLGWLVTRYQSGTPCKRAVFGNSWTDSGCGMPGNVIEEFYRNRVEYYVREYDSSIVTYVLTPMRKDLGGYDETFAAGTRVQYGERFAWRDSTDFVVDAGSRLQGLGSWILVTRSGKGRLSKDGKIWHDAPDSLLDSSWSATSQTDSVWFVRLDSVLRRVDVVVAANGSAWSSRSFPVDSGWKRLLSVASDSGNLVMAIDQGGDPRKAIHLWRSTSSGLVEWTENVGSLKGVADPAVMVSLATGRFIQGNIGSGILRYTVSPKATSDDEVEIMVNGQVSRFVGTLDEGRTVVLEQASLDLKTRRLMLVAPAQDARLLSFPAGVSNWNPSSVALLGDEIWAMQDGHLWKGKLNLPK
ncbi:MAG: hypothetical protein AAB214_13310 [Fibrobacterota bacterium]